jgi:hypothetical protein
MSPYCLRLSGSIFLCLMVCTLELGCGDDDDGTVGTGVGNLDGGGRPPILPGADVSNLTDAISLPGDDGGLVSDSGVILDRCEPGAKECVLEGGDTARECSVEGIWNNRRCVGDEVCVAGDCVNSALGCTPGETVCLASGNVGICDNDSWVDQGTCGDGLACTNGRCVSAGCVAALRGSSYIGCEFLTLDLANSAFDTRDINMDGLPDGTTSNSPTGLVVANNSDIESTTLTLLGPNGMPARVISRRVIEVPNISAIPVGQYSATTVTSNIRDAVGAIVEDDIRDAVELVVPPGGTATLLLPRGRLDWTAASIRRAAFKLNSTQPVVAYQFSPYCCNFSFSNDASLLFPTSSLGTNYRYIGPAHHQFFRPNQNDFFGCSGASRCFDPNDVCVNNTCGRYSNESAMMTLVGAVDGTEITVELPNNQQVIGYQGVDSAPLTGSFQLTLDAQDVAILPTVYRQSDATDLSGARLTSNHPFVVFSGHVCSFFPSTAFACDHLQEQLVPTSTWGSQYQLVPVAERGNNYPAEVVYWKVLSNEDGTNVGFSVPFSSLNSVGSSNPTMPDCGSRIGTDGNMVLNAGEFCEFGTKAAVQLRSSRPVLVAGFLVGQEATAPPGSSPFGLRGGDPAMFLMPTDQQFRQDYVFLTPDTYFMDFVTIITPPGNEIILNEGPLDLGMALPVPGSDFVYTHVELTRDGPQKLLGAMPFGIIVYAYDDFVSYAFTGGINLTKF